MTGKLKAQSSSDMAENIMILLLWVLSNAFCCLINY